VRNIFIFIIILTVLTFFICCEKINKSKINISENNNSNYVMNNENALRIILPNSKGGTEVIYLNKDYERNEYQYNNKNITVDYFKRDADFDDYFMYSHGYSTEYFDDINAGIQKGLNEFPSWYFIHNLRKLIINDIITVNGFQVSCAEGIERHLNSPMFISYNNYNIIIYINSEDRIEEMLYDRILKETPEYFIFDLNNIHEHYRIRWKNTESIEKFGNDIITGKHKSNTIMEWYEEIKIIQNGIRIISVSEKGRKENEEISIFGYVEEPPAGAKELMNVMPNSWQNMTRLSKENEELFLKTNTRILDKIISTARGSWIANKISLNNNITVTTRVYREQAGTDVFFRLLTFPEKDIDFYNHDNICFLQSLVYNNKGRLILLAMGAYNQRTAYDKHHVGGGILASYSSITIIPGKDKTKGILAATVNIDMENVDTSLVNARSIRNNHIFGDVIGLYMQMANIDKINDSMRMNDRISSGVYFHDESIISLIKIEASSCLVDAECPLRYGLQNAFDGKSSTSYIGNAADDLIILYFGINYRDIESVAIINGFAQNQELYFNYNRVKEIKDDIGHGKKYYLKDNDLSYQIINNYGNSFIYITDIYSGNKNKYTCISELNVKIKNNWLFGDLNE